MRQCFPSGLCAYVWEGLTTLLEFFIYILSLGLLDVGEIQRYFRRVPEMFTG